MQPERSFLLNTNHKVREHILRLTKPVKARFLRILFSRFLLFALLIILQFTLLGILLYILDEYFPWLAAALVLTAIAVVVYLFNTDMDSSAKLTWMLLISVLPIPGSLMLLYTRKNLGQRKMQRNIDRQIKNTQRLIPQSEEVTEALEAHPSGLTDLSAYLCRSGCFPVFGHTAVSFFRSGEEKFSALLEELERAEKYIFLEYFIIEEGYMWGRILDILVRKAAEGVDVRVIYDGMCELSQLPARYPELLAPLGIRAKVHAPLRPVLSTQYNYRDHRKILVIDGKTAFTGGVNLADEYINRKARFGYWKDTAIMLKGDAVRSFTLMFLQMWNVGEEAPVYEPYLRQAPDCLPPSDGFVMPYAGSPLDGERTAENVFIDILYRAVDYVHIMTPYLILDNELENALKFAAKRGVDVKIILPGIPDKKTAYALAKTHYRVLVEAGVRIFEYTPGFVHAKICVSDGQKAVVGTINFDYRSLYHHFECAAYLYRCSCIAGIEDDFLETLSACREVTPARIEEEKLSYRLTGMLLKCVAPLM